ncbi:MAG TPA: outer membrane lipoprotein chaperone LolA [Longimicrobium sp.]|jgi:chaperone LolA
MKRYLPCPALLLLPLALAACGGGREAPGDAPQRRSSVQVKTAPRAGTPVAGGDTALAAAGQAAPAANGQPAGGTAAAPAGARPAGPNAGEAPAPPPQGGRQDQAAEILRRVEQTAAGIRTFEADFVQTLTVPLLGTNTRSAGKLYQRKPDRFLMKFSDPAGDVVVADGRHFWIYYPSSDRTQVIRTSIAQGGEQADFQRQFLSNATERFVATLNGEENVGGEATWALTLVPRRESPYKVIRVWVDKDDHLVRRFEMTEENDSVRRLELRNLRVNQPIADALFTFTPPPGTQVFDQ